MRKWFDLVKEFITVVKEHSLALRELSATLRSEKAQPEPEAEPEISGEAISLRRR